VLRTELVIARGILGYENHPTQSYSSGVTGHPRVQLALGLGQAFLRPASARDRTKPKCPLGVMEVVKAGRMVVAGCVKGKAYTETELPITCTVTAHRSRVSKHRVGTELG
jgi:hypothetical protein